MHPATPSPSTALRRRTALGGLVALGTVAAGCTGGTDDGPAAPATRPAREPRPDVALAATVLAAEQDVLDLVQATMRRHHRLRGLLGNTRDVHREHVRLLTEAVPSEPASPASASPSPPSPASPSASGVHVPADRAKALAAVARAEDELGLEGKRSAFRAESGAFARILASMAAAAAQQAALVRRDTHHGATR